MKSFNKFFIYKTKVELEREIKIIRFDRGDEYSSNQLVQHYEENGIRHEETAPHSHQSNGVCERKK